MKKQRRDGYYAGLVGPNWLRKICQSCSATMSIRASNPFYAETKVAVEEHILTNCHNAGCASTILRLATAYGISPRMRFDLTVSDFTRQLAIERELLVYDKHSWRPYCHVADISEAIVKLLCVQQEKGDCRGAQCRQQRTELH